MLLLFYILFPSIDLNKQIEKSLDQLESVYEQRIEAANKLLLISLGKSQNMVEIIIML